MDYSEFLEAKKVLPVISGHDVADAELNANLFDFQRAIVKWAIKRGRAAIFADTGLGKTLMQTSWADEVVKETGGDVLILAPLCVAHQTVGEGEKFGIAINYCRDQSGIKPGINITNYEMLDRFDFDAFHGIVLDESSIIKNRDGKTRNAIIDACKNVPYRLSCTATPSPNDFMELGNQAELLGLMTMAEMLAMYFINDAGDTGTWILKGHGKAKFWEWLATWSVVIRSPADLGFDASRYDLPELVMHDHVVESKATVGLFADIATGLLERNHARKESIDDRVKKVYDIVNAEMYNKSLSLGGVCHEQSGIHETVPAEKYGEMEKDARAAGESKREEEEALRGRPWKKSGSEGSCKALAAKQSRCEEVAEDKKVRDNARSVQQNDGIMRHEMPNMRDVRHNEQKHIPDGGPLPQNDESTRDTLLELQSCTGEDEGQHKTSGVGHSISESQWVIWCHRNEEQEKLEKLFGDRCFSVYGSLTIEEKERRILAWGRGDRPILLSKPSVTGFGMNWQHCNHTAFVGLSDSWEQYYQAIRRFYRFGQKNSVNVHVISAESEGAVVENIKRKEEQNKTMGAEMVKYMSESMKKEIFGLSEEKTEYIRQVHEGDGYTIHNADCIDLAREIESDSVGFTIYSPPFASLFTYSNSDRDMGNSKGHGEFYRHFGYLVDELLRITMPGRLMAVHCMNLPTSKVNDGFIGIRDFRGELIRMFVEKGWIYHSEVCIWKDPVTAMQRTKALGLLHKTIKKDSSMSRQGLADYLVIMRKPGSNPVPISHTPDEFPVDMWQQYASPVWFDINQSRTLNFKDAREDDDVKHICPLQLDVIERAMNLWSAPGDLVFSPFTGVGSEGYTAVKMGRRFIGSELKPTYYQQAIKNIADARAGTLDLFAS